MINSEKQSGARSRHLTAATDELPTTGPIDLTGLARALAVSPAVWAPVAVHDPEHRVHVRLAAAPGWEADLITWPSGHRIELHDHGSSRGAVAVVRIVRHRIGAGTVRPVPPGRIHDVVNAGRATSIHVDGPALETMTFHDDELRPVRTERVFPETPLLALGEVSALLAGAPPG